MKEKIKCSRLECNRKAKVKDLCLSHYCIERQRGTFGGPICTVPECEKVRFSKLYCHNHYLLNQRNGKPEYKEIYFQQCSVLGCPNKVSNRSRSILCIFHYKRRYNGIKLERPYGIKNENNPRWGGGTSEYPNHSLMKKVRLEVLKEANYICHFCGSPANKIHHKDLSKDNHSKENLVACCNRCNTNIRHKPNTSKYKRLLSYSHKELLQMDRNLLRDIQLMEKNLEYNGYQPIENLMVFRTKIHHIKGG